MPSSSLSSNEINFNLINFTKAFFFDKNFFLNNQENEKIINLEHEIPLKTFLFFKKPSFISFFINNFVDVPICFKKSTSLKRKNFELPLVKICTLLMKQGKKEKTIKLFFKTLRNRCAITIEKLSVFSNDFYWTPDYLLLTNILYTQISTTPLFIEQSSEFFNTEIAKLNVFNRTNRQNKLSIIKNLTFIAPIFAYFIYSVDKNVKKFSRGKSGKYRFVWKYIAPFRRSHVILKWLAKEIKFINEKKFCSRIQKFFLLLGNSPENTFTWKSKNFSHNYVFRNFKKTLMTTLRTTL